MSTREVVARWYWCGVFGDEPYAEGIEVRRFARDLHMNVPAWIHGAGTEPGTIAAPNFQFANRLLTLQTSQRVAAYKGCSLLLHRVQGGIGAALPNRPVGCEHGVRTCFSMTRLHNTSQLARMAIPARAALQETLGFRELTYEYSIINKTALSAHTNRHCDAAVPQTRNRLGYLRGIGSGRLSAERKVRQSCQTRRNALRTRRDVRSDEIRA